MLVPYVKYTLDTITERERCYIYWDVTLIPDKDIPTTDPICVVQQQQKMYVNSICGLKTRTTEMVNYSKIRK
jgi:hypothetical protein